MLTRSLGPLRHRQFASLWTAGLVSLMGDWVLVVGLPIHVFLLTGSALATSGMFAAGAIPRILLGSVVGVYVDRWDRQRTLLFANLLQAAALVPLLFVRDAGDVWIVYVVAAVESILSQFVGPAEDSLLPHLVPSEELTAANALNALNNNLARLIGPAIGGVVAGTLGLSGIALVDSASFLIAAGLLATLPPDPRPGRAGPPEATSPLRRLLSEWVEGIRLVARTRPLVVVFSLVAVTAVGEGVFSVMYVLFVSEVVGGGAEEIGLFMSAQAVGGIAGALVVSRISRNIRPALLLGVSMVVFGLVDLAIFNAPGVGFGVAAIAVLFVLVGIPTSGGFPAMNTLIQQNTTDAHRGRVFGAMGTTNGALRLVGLGIAGTLAGPIGIVPILNIQGFSYVLAGFLVLIALRETRSGPEP